MALPAVGLDAVISNLSSFENGARSIQKAYDAINQKAGTVEKSTGAMGRAFSGLSGIMGSVAGGLGNIAAVAGGIVTANIFGRIAQGIGDFTSSGLAAVGAQQTLEAGLGALLTSNNLYEESVQKIVTAHTKELMSAEELAQRNAELTSSIDVQKATIQENKQRLIDLTAKWGDNGLATIKAREQLEQMQVRLQGTESDLKNLTATETTYETQTKTTFNQVMDFKEAQKLAAEQSERLLAFVDKLSIVSPFERDQVATVSKFAVQAGLGVEAVEKFTAGFLDLAAATGINSANLDFAADQLLQVKKVGQIFEGDLRQLRRIGIDLNRIIGVEMGMSVEEFNAKAKESPEIFDELFAAVGTFANKNFPGAAKKMASTIDGIGSTFKDLIVVAQREFFTPIVEAVTPMALDMIDTLSSFFLGGGMADLGEKAGKFITDGIAKGMKVVSTFKAGGLAVFSEFLGAEGVTLWFKLKDLFKTIGTTITELGKAFDLVMPSFEGLSTGGVLDIIIQGVDLLNQGFKAAIPIITQVTGIIEKVMGAFERFGARGATISILGQLGLEPEQIATVLQTIDLVTEKVNAFMTGGLFGTMKETPGGMQETGGLLRALGINEDFPTILENWAGQVIAAIPGVLTGILSSIATFATDNWPIISDALASWTTKFWDWAKNAAAGAGTAMSVFGIALLAWAFSPEAQETMSTLGHTLGVMLTDAIKRNFEGGEGASNVLVSLATGLLTAVGSIFGTLIILGGQIVAGILSGILESFGISLQPTTFSNLSVILTNIGNDIKTIAKTIGTKIVTSIKTGWDNTVETITTAFQTGVDSWMTIVTETKWLELGASIIEGILEGIKNNAGKVLEKLKSLMGDFLSTAAAAVGYGSPAAKFIPLGASIPEGIAVGIGQGANSVTAAMGEITQATLDSLLGVQRNVVSVNGAIGQARDKVEKFLETTIDDGKSQRALRIMGQIFRDNSEIILGASNRVAKFQELLGNVNFGVNNQQQNAIMGSVGIWLSEFDKNLAAMKAAQKQIFIEAGRTALTIGSKLNDIVSSSADILDQRVKTLQELMDSGLAEVNFDGQIMSAVQAQELLNIALAEQREIQDDILQLKQNEQKLSFLEKQLSLVETLNEAGLDVNDILGGISLGLDASIPDMIAATNKLVMAMIEQVNQDLQIASPSKVMAKKGLFAGEGFAEGILASIPDVMGAMKRAIIGPSMVSGPVLSGGGNSRVTNNNFSMSVNSGASPQAVMQQFEIARSMA